MPRISFFFFTTGALFVLCGVGLGIWMGANQNFTLAPVHAHINLIGWASMGLMGAFFAVAGESAPRKLGWCSYGLTTVGLAIMVPSLALLLLGDRSVTPVLAGAEILIALAMVLFFVTVVVTWSRQRPAVALAAALPAE